jgi:tRNA A-37 threonylcarbamoyl transferase component Bud32
MSAVVCPDDHELLAVASGEEMTPEIQGHLDACIDCRQRLGRLQAEVSNLRNALGDQTLPSIETIDAVVAPPADPSPPQTIGKYLVLDVLGRGGQADVFRALNPALGREVVIKLGRRASEWDREDRERLLAEGKMLAELDQPCLARVHDLDFHEGHPFLVMEYVRGRTLRQHAEEQRPTSRQAAALVAQLARALAVAHRRGIVHQDLKPTNVLIDEAGRPHVIDFGMARLVHAWADRRLQPEGGTAAYMAPEQARGESERITPRSDIFALGGILYYLLTGRAPFGGGSWAEQLDRAGRCDFDRSALRAAKTPRRLEAICLRAMAAEPGERHAGVEELATDLERYVSRPRRAALLAGVIAVTVLAWPIWKALHSRAIDDTPRPQVEVRLPADPLSVRLLRKERYYDLKNAQKLAGVAPLRNGDELKINVPAPPGLFASLFLIGSTGQVEHLADAAPGELLNYPPGAGTYKALDNRPGTEALLVCWRRSGPVGVEELRTLWESAPWPALAETSVLRLDRDGVEVVQKGRPFGPTRAHSDPEGDIRARLERLRLRLHDRVDFLTGIAFAHKDDRSAP